MAHPVPNPPPGFDDLSAEEKIDYIQSLWERIATPTEATQDALPLTAAQRAELDRRLDELDREGPVGIPWDQVLKQIRSRKR